MPLNLTSPRPTPPCRSGEGEPTGTGAVHGVAPVLGADEWRAVAQVGRAGFVDAAADGPPQVAGQGGGLTGRGTSGDPSVPAQSPANRFGMGFVSQYWLFCV
jgi:hypothetical protein